MKVFLARLVGRDERPVDSVTIAGLFSIVVLSGIAFVRPEAVAAYAGGAAGIIIAIGGSKCARDWKGTGDVGPQ